MISTFLFRTFLLVLALGITAELGVSQTNHPVAIGGTLEFTSSDGELTTGRLSRIEPDGLVIKTDAGITKLKFETLPVEVQTSYGYDSSKAAEFKEKQQQIAVQAAKNTQAARAVADNRDAAERAQQASEDELRRTEAEIRSRAATAFRVRGQVVQNTSAGLLVFCSEPEPSYSYGMQSVGGGGGSNKKGPKEDRPESVAGTFLVVGHPSKSSLADKSIIDVDAYEDGLFSYVDTQGAQRNVKKVIVTRTAQ